jgi:hypothetical protein
MNVKAFWFKIEASMSLPTFNLRLRRVMAAALSFVAAMLQHCQFADAASLSMNVPQARLSVTIDSIQRWSDGGPTSSRPTPVFLRALSMSPAFPHTLPGFIQLRCHTPLSCGRGVYVIYRRTPNSFVWRAIALSRKAVFKPGSEIGWSLTAVPSPPYFLGDNSGPVRLTQQIFDAVTRHSCHNLVATELIDRANGKRLLGIRANGEMDSKHPCLSISEAENVLHGESFPTKE